MNKKWKWVLGITRATIIFLLPSLILVLLLPDNGFRMMNFGNMFLLSLIMIIWVVVVIFGLSEEV